MRVAAGVAESFHFVVQRFPVTGKDVGAGDDDVDLSRAQSDARTNFLNPLLDRTQAGRKTGRHGGNRDAGSRQRLDGGRYEGVIHADGAHLNAELLGPERLEQILSNGVTRLGA